MASPLTNQQPNQQRFSIVAARMACAALLTNLAKRVAPYGEVHGVTVGERPTQNAVPVLSTDEQLALKEMNDVLDAERQKAEEIRSRFFPKAAVLAVTCRLPVDIPAHGYDVVRFVLNKPDMSIKDVIASHPEARAEILMQHTELARVTFPVDKYMGLPECRQRQDMILNTLCQVPYGDIELWPVRSAPIKASNPNDAPAA